MKTPRPPYHSRRPRRRGLSLAEVLIATSITASILLSVAMAYSASAQAIKVNDDFVRASQTARIGVRNIVEAVRTSEACRVGPQSAQSSGLIENADTLSIILADGTVVSYVFDEANRQLLYRIEDEANPVQVVLARNVDFARFTGEVEPHPHTGLRRTIRVLVEIQVGVGGQTLYLCGSSVPRREMIYAGQND